MFGMGTGGSLRLLSPEILGFVWVLFPFAPSKPHRSELRFRLTKASASLYRNFSQINSGFQVVHSSRVMVFAFDCRLSFSCSLFTVPYSLHASALLPERQAPTAPRWHPLDARGLVAPALAQRRDCCLQIKPSTY